MQYNYPQAAQFAPPSYWGDKIAAAAPIMIDAQRPDLYADPGLIPFGVQQPLAADPAFAPQGAIGSWLGRTVGGAVGGRYGHRGFGEALGGFAGGFLPFQAGPGMETAQPQFAPQGRWGNFIRDVAPIAGRHVGGNWGRAISTVGSMADMLPFQAGPDAYGYPQEAYVEQPAFAPQGLFGGLIGGAVGGLIGKRFGNRGLGSAIGSIAGGFLPFQAGPGMATSEPQFAPQGRWGNFIRDVAPVAGRHVGGNWGRAISTVGSMADMLPFQAGPEAYGYAPEAYPTEAAFAPQGAFGSWLGRTVGGAVGGRYGHRGLGQAIGGFAGNLLPFSAGPEAYGYAPEAYPTEAAFAPQGAFGSWLGRTAGGALGGRYGQRGLGEALGGFAGGFLPFQAGPGMVAAEPQFAPQGRWGNFIRDVAPIAGRHAGGNWGRAISTVGSMADMLPFQAGPDAYGYAYPQGEQIVYH